MIPVEELAKQIVRLRINADERGFEKQQLKQLVTMSFLQRVVQ